MKPSDATTWTAHNVTILKAEGDTIRGMPWTPEGLPITDIEVVGSKRDLMQESEARNVALN